MFFRLARKIPQPCFKPVSFFYRVTKHFLNSHGIIVANSLSFSLIFAFIPFVIALASLGSWLPLSSHLINDIEYFYFNSFIPQSGKEIYKLFQLSFAHSNKLSIIGVISLLISSYGLMFTIEDHINMMFKTIRNRSIIKSICLFTIIILLNFALVYGLGFTSLTVYKLILNKSFIYDVNFFLSHGVTICVFILIYKLLPYKTISWVNAITCGICATIVFAIIQQYFIFSMQRMQQEYALLYGSLAVLPIFLLWVYSEILILIFFAAMLYLLERTPKINN